MKKLHSIKGIPLSYIQSILKIDLTSLSGLTWLPREDDIRWNNRYANKIAGGLHVNIFDGYQSWNVSIKYNNKKKSLKCSRIIFLLHNGYLTEGKQVDHADGNSLNNKVNNIRESTEYQNAQNRGMRSDNSSGHKGVYWDKRNKKWKVQIYAHGKYHYFGLYANKQEAIKVAIESRKKLHGEFGRDE